jgi:hypothetical protein
MKKSTSGCYLLGLVLLGGGTAARAQTGAESRSQPAAPQARTNAAKPLSARSLAPPERGISYNRLTTVRTQVMSTTSPRAARGARAAGGASPGLLGSMTQAEAHLPFSAQGPQAARSRAALAGSWQEPARPAPPDVGSTTHNYFPGMRPEQHPNGNTVQITRGRGRVVCVPSRGQLLGSGTQTRR